MPEQIPAGHVDVAGLGASAAEHDGVEIAAKIGHLDVAADIGVGNKIDSLFLHDLHSAIDEAFFKLEVGDSVHQQSADAVGPFKNRDGMPGLVELRRARQPRRAGADDGDLFPRAFFRRLGFDPSLLERVFDDAQLDVLDRDGFIVDAQHAGFLARGGANPAGEFGEIVGLAAACPAHRASGCGRPDRSIRG